MNKNDEGKQALKMNNDMEGNQGMSKGGGSYLRSLLGGRTQRGIEIKSEPIAQIIGFQNLLE